MSIEVNRLSKVFGEQRAVSDLSFSVSPGQIIGFLGPNGAGKSTTMKMLTCFTNPSEGSAKVNGYDIVEQPLEVRKSVGYLPEHNPLYKDMYVREFLSFVAGVHKVSKPQKRIEDLIEMTGLGLEQKKRIGTLSKGYRQRVGLAQAMMHDPAVLILDEPTSGLDPNQLSDIRALIEELGREKTVVFSTHIMQEVTALCSRVLIINRGILVADDPIELLQNRIEGNYQYVVDFNTEVNELDLRNIEGVTGVLKTEGKWNLLATQDIRKEIFQWAVSKNVILLELTPKMISVENVFRELTKTGAND